MTILPDDSHLSIEEALMDIAVQSWKSMRLADRVVSKLDVGEQTRYVNQFKFFNRKITDRLKSAGYTVKDLTGHTFETGMAVSVINMEEFGEQDVLEVEHMLEPLIMKDGKIRRTGTVSLRKSKR